MGLINWEDQQKKIIEQEKLIKEEKKKGLAEPLNLGDIISFFVDNNGINDGFLSVDGIIDFKFFTKNSINGQFPNNFKDCLFKLQRTMKTDAYKEFKKKVKLLI
jgi:hypothetical protein